MKICHICGGFPPAVGGTETHNYSLVSYLSIKGYEVDVIVLRPTIAELKLKGYSKNIINEIHKKEYSLPKLKNVRIYNISRKGPIIDYYRIWKKVREIERKYGKIDIIDVHSYALAIPFSKKRKIVLSLHFFELICPTVWPRPCNSSLKDCSKCVGYFRYFHWKYTKFLVLNKISKIMVKYDYAKNILVKNGLDKDKIVIIPHWIDIQKFRKKRINNKSDNSFVFMFIGRLSEEKGVDILIEAFSKIQDDTKKLVLVGDGSLKYDLIDNCKKKGIKNIEFLGNVPHDQVKIFLLKSDCVVFPHRYFNYEWALLEAMAAGKPIIATDVAATKDILKDKYNSLLISVNVDSLYNKMLEIMTNTIVAQNIAKNAYNTIKTRHRYDNLIKYEEMIRNL